MVHGLVQDNTTKWEAWKQQKRLSLFLEARKPTIEGLAWRVQGGPCPASEPAPPRRVLSRRTRQGTSAQCHS